MVVGFKHPVMIRIVSFMDTSTSLECAEFLHTGAAYSAADMHKAKDDVLSTSGFAPHVVPVSFIIMLFLVIYLLLKPNYIVVYTVPQFIKCKTGTT